MRVMPSFSQNVGPRAPSLNSPGQRPGQRFSTSAAIRSMGISTSVSPTLFQFTLPAAVTSISPSIDSPTIPPRACQLWPSSKSWLVRKVHSSRPGSNLARRNFLAISFMTALVISGQSTAMGFSNSQTTRALPLKVLLIAAGRASRSQRFRNSLASKLGSSLAS